MGFIHRTERRPTIDLQGPAGNAFSLMAQAQAFGRDLGWEQDAIKEVLTEMKSSDYKNLVRVFNNNFGDYVDIILPDKWTWDEEKESDIEQKAFISPVVKITPRGP